MKKLIVLITISTLSTAVSAQESSWFDSLKSLIGLGDAQEQSVNANTPTTSAPTANGLIDVLTNSLNVNNEQATGGMGAILNYVKNNVSSDQFMQLAKTIPGVDGLISKMPDLNNLKSGSADNSISGLLDKAAEYSDSLKSVNDVKKQFESLGLKPEMIGDFISTAQSYLDTEQGQPAKDVLADSVGKFFG